MENETFAIADERSPGWFFIDNAIYDTYGPQLGPIGLAVYGYLCRLSSNDKKTCYPSFSKIAAVCGISRSSVIRTINTLLELGLVGRTLRDQDHGGKASNLYTLYSVKLTPSVTRTLPSVSETLPLVSQGHPTKTHETKTQGTPPEVPHTQATKKQDTLFTFKESRDRKLGRQAGNAASYTPPSERKANPLAEKANACLYQYKKLLDYELPYEEDQLGFIMQMLKKGYEVEQIIECYMSMTKDEFWSKQEFISMKHVGNRIGGYLKKEKEKNAWKETLPKQPVLPKDYLSTPEAWREATKNGW